MSANQLTKFLKRLCLTIKTFFYPVPNRCSATDFDQKYSSFFTDHYNTVKYFLYRLYDSDIVKGEQKADEYFAHIYYSGLPAKGCLFSSVCQFIDRPLGPKENGEMILTMVIVEINKSVSDESGIERSLLYEHFVVGQSVKDVAHKLGQPVEWAKKVIERFKKQMENNYAYPWG